MPQGDEGYAGGVASFPPPFWISQQKSPNPHTSGRRGVMWSKGPPDLPPSSPASSRPPPSLPAGQSYSIVPHCGTAPPPAPPPPTPPQSSPLTQFPNPRPHSPLGNWEREGSPGSRLLNLDPYQHSHPHPAQGCWSRGGCGMGTLHWINSVPTPLPNNTPRPVPSSKSPGSGSSPLSMPLPTPVLLSHYQRPFSGLWPLAVASQNKSLRGRRRGLHTGRGTSLEAPLPKSHRPSNFSVRVTRRTPSLSSPFPTSPPGWDPPMSHTPFHSYTQPNKETDTQSAFPGQVSPKSVTQVAGVPEVPLPKPLVHAVVGAPE